MKKFSHWIFDLDGTIFDSTQQYEMFIKNILAQFKIEPSGEELARAYNYFNPDEYFASFPISEAQVKHAVQELIRLNIEFAHQTPVFEGIEESLLFLRSKGVRLSVWTGRDLASAQKLLEGAGFHKYMEACVGRTCVEKTKPFPDGLLKILKESPHPSEDVVMIGDHEYDIRGAISAKVSCISVNWDGKGHPEAKRLSNLHFDQVKDLNVWMKKHYA